VKLLDRHARSLVLALRETHDVEIDCEEFQSLMPKHAEARCKGRLVVDGLFHQHERLCGPCREELQVLIEMIREQAGGGAST
jgi:hypothetical protein